MTDTHETGPGDPAAPQYPNVPHGNQQYAPPEYSASQYGQQPFAQQPFVQQPYYGQPPVPQAQPPKKKRKWPWIVGGIVVLLIVIAALSGGGSDDSSDEVGTSGNAGATNEAADTPAAKAKDDDAGAGLNTPVRDGKFEFVVTNVQTGLQSVGDNPYLTEKAQGQFVVVTMTIKNIGDRPQGFSPSDQKLVDAQGRSFESDTTAQIALGGTDIAVWDNINPGNAVEVRVVYDMPADAVPASIELHDSMFSGGEKVSLE